MGYQYFFEFNILSLLLVRIRSRRTVNSNKLLYNNSKMGQNLRTRNSQKKTLQNEKEFKQFFLNLVKIGAKMIPNFFVPLYFNSNAIILLFKIKSFKMFPTYRAISRKDANKKYGLNWNLSFVNSFNWVLFGRFTNEPKRAELRCARAWLD